MQNVKHVNRTDMGEPLTETSWPRNIVKAIDCRKRDVIVRIADWSRQSPGSGDPGYDVEVYVHGVYDWNLSKCFTLSSGLTKTQAKQAATKYAGEMLTKILGSA
jgi:hypothetical protein